MKIPISVKAQVAQYHPIPIANPIIGTTLQYTHPEFTTVYSAGHREIQEQT